ncbi:hypothetical protein RAS2_16500 [Phycisphaerae bacterium RAS2]|nr:hypothetical protein RAS2_16500 [Phycisphaerae bacterium RAS2]
MGHRIIKAKLWEASGRHGFDLDTDGPDSRALVARVTMWLRSIGASLTIQRMVFHSILLERSYTMKVRITGNPAHLAIAKAESDPTCIFGRRYEELKWLNSAPNLNVSTWSLARNPTVHYLIETPDEPRVILNSVRLVAQHGGWIQDIDARTLGRLFRKEALVIMPSGDSARSLTQSLIGLREEFGYRTVEARVLEPLIRATA